MRKKYLTKSCINCANLEHHQISEEENLFVCHITDEVVDVTEYCKFFTINKKIKFVLEELSGVLLTDDEINQALSRGE